MRLEIQILFHLLHRLLKTLLAGKTSIATFAMNWFPAASGGIKRETGVIPVLSP
jgi:hypothetical protein